MSAAVDEGWRRVLHGMLQRDPKHRSKLSDVRRQLIVLARRMEESKARAQRLADTSMTDVAAAFTAVARRRL